MSAVLFGSISTLADTSELQRQAFNDAFKAHGLDWEWDQEDYREMLTGNGGKQRIADYAKSTGEDVDAESVHRAKSERFRDLVSGAELSPRDGVVQTIREAREQGVQVALVTTTSEENVTALLDALGDDVAFDLTVDISDVQTPKPDGEAYEHALRSLGESAAECVAIEDNTGGVEAANAAGIPSVAFPNQNTAGHDFGGAGRRVDSLSLADLAPGNGGQ